MLSPIDNFSGFDISKSLTKRMCASQALKHLKKIQVINFGDCLLRPAGAIAIAESVSEGLPILRVSEMYNLALRLRVIIC